MGVSAAGWLRALGRSRVSHKVQPGCSHPHPRKGAEVRGWTSPSEGRLQSAQSRAGCSQAEPASALLPTFPCAAEQSSPSPPFYPAEGYRLLDAIIRLCVVTQKSEKCHFNRDLEHVISFKNEQNNHGGSLMSLLHEELSCSSFCPIYLICHLKYGDGEHRHSCVLTAL